jgi:hypothetical protein
MEGFMNTNDKKDTKTAKIIPMPGIELIPVDYAISICIQNMFATYGEAKVRASLKELFGMDSKQSNKKVA